MGKDLRHPNIQLPDGAVHINGKKYNLPITKEYILEYRDVFSGIVTLPWDQHYIKLIKPVQYHHTSA